MSNIYIKWTNSLKHEKLPKVTPDKQIKLTTAGSIKEIDLITYKLSKKKTLCTDGFTRKLFKTLGNNANYIQNILENTMGRNTFQFIDETTLP